MQHSWPYLFVRLSEIASCSAYGNKLFKMKLSLRTKEFLWLSTLESWFLQKWSIMEKSCSENLLFYFSARQEEVWGLIDSCLTVVFLGKTGFFLVSCRPLLIRYNLLETEDYSPEFYCVQPTCSPEPSLLKIAHDAQLWRQRPPAAVRPAVVMLVMKTLIFQGSLKMLFVNRINE